MDLCDLPYFSDDPRPPAELPSVEQITCATEVLKSSTSRKVVGIGSHFVVKWGLQVNPFEGQTMIPATINETSDSSRLCTIPKFRQGHDVYHHGAHHWSSLTNRMAQDERRLETHCCTQTTTAPKTDAKLGITRKLLQCRHARTPGLAILDRRRVSA